MAGRLTWLVAASTLIALSLSGLASVELEVGILRPGTP
jgi:hypothetical protein